MALPSFNNFPQAFGQFDPAVTLSGDGRYLAYASYMDGTRHADIFTYDSATGAMHVLGSDAGSDNYCPVVAAGGAALAFTSAAADGLQRIAVADLATGALAFASTAADGSAANGDSRFASISADGRYVAFDSAASNLVAGDTNGAGDVFVKDMASGAVQRVSVGVGGVQLDGGADGAQISSDGKLVLFHTQDGLYAANLASGALTLVAADSSGHTALSADGRYVVFSTASDIGNDVNANYDVFRKDLVSGALEQVSTNAAGLEGAGASTDPSISADGRYVAFGYDAGDLAGGATHANNDIYVKDMLTGAVRQVSHGSAPGQDAFHAAISADATRVAYASYAGTAGENFDVSWNVVSARLAAPGSAGPDQFVSSPDNDNWDGGAGLDLATYHGQLADYALNVGIDSVQVSDSVAGRDGSDSLSGTERLQFADASVALDTASGVAGQAYRIYQAAFDRAPDQAGLGYWIAALDHGQTLQAVAQGFVQSAEFGALYGSAPTNAEVVDKLYLNVLHRAGEDAGVAYWNGVLDHGQANVAAVLASFSESAENIAALVGTLEHGVTYLPFG